MSSLATSTAAGKKLYDIAYSGPSSWQKLKTITLHARQGATRSANCPAPFRCELRHPVRPRWSGRPDA